jgi:zinc transporter
MGHKIKTEAHMPSDTDAIVFGWTFDGNGGGRRLEPAETAEEVRNAGLSWVHLNATDDGARTWLQAEAKYLDDIILDALLADETRPRVLDVGTGMLLILRGINTNPESDPEDMVSLRLWIDDERIISIERRQVETIRYIDTRTTKGTGPKDSGAFLAMMCSHLFENLDLALGRLHDRLDTMEELVETDSHYDPRQEALEIRRAAITFRRYVAPQRAVLEHLKHTEFRWIDTQTKRGFQEDADQVLRTIEDLELIRERAQITYELTNSALAQRVNRNVYFLSAIATIFMPLTFVTGLFGMNVDIPYSDHPYAFSIICGITIGLAALQGIVFRLMKWL